jgi:ankyrin repeat protein/predicted aspartyl protease
MRVEVMNYRRNVAPVIATISVFAAASCKLAAVGTATPPALVSLPESLDQVVIPLSRAGDWLCVRVRIDGKDAGWFVVDTGATCTTIDKGVVKELGLRHIRDKRAHADSGDVNAEFVGYSKLEVGRVSLHQGLAAAVDLSSISSKARFKVSGLLGDDLLREQPFVIDFPASTLTLLRPRSFMPPAGVDAQPVMLRAGRPIVRGRVEGNDGWFLIDTGMTGNSPMIPVRYYWEQHWEGRLEHFGKASATGMSQTTDAYTGVLGPVELMGKRTEKRRVLFTTKESGLYEMGSIGAGAMSEGRFTFAYATGHMWVEWPSPEPTEQMLKRLGDPHGKDLTGRTPLMIAASVGRADVVVALCKLGVDVDAKDADENTALMYAARNAQPQSTKALLSAGANYKLTSDSMTALHLAARSGDLGSVKALLASGADCDAPDSDHETPLMYALLPNYQDVAHALLDAGARVNIEDKYGTSPLTYAAAYADLPMVKSLIARGAKVNPAGRTPLMFAATAGNFEVAKFLLSEGAKIDSTDATGMTALMLAAQNRHEAVVGLLLGAGANATVRSREGKTAVEYASDPYTLRTLVSSGQLRLDK